MDGLTFAKVVTFIGSLGGVLIGAFLSLPKF